MVSFLVKILCLQQLRFPQKRIVTEFIEVARIQSSNLLGGKPILLPLGHQITDIQNAFKLTLQFMHINFIRLRLIHWNLVKVLLSCKLFLKQRSPPVWASKNTNIVTAIEGVLFWNN